MTRRQRRWHFVVWLVLTPALGLAIGGAVAVRQAKARPTSVTLKEPAEQGGRGVADGRGSAAAGGEEREDAGGVEDGAEDGVGGGTGP